MEFVINMDTIIEYAKKPDEGKPWDVTIVGSGPAALTAAIYTTRGAASTLILGGAKWGGQLMLTTNVDNYPGFTNISGPEKALYDNFGCRSWDWCRIDLCAGFFKQFFKRS